MLSLNGRFNLTHVSFSREGSKMCIFENASDGKLFLSLSRISDTHESVRANLIRLVPVFEDKELPFTYFADPSLLRIDTEYGKIDFCFPEKDYVYVRSMGRVGLRFEIQSLPGEAFCPVEDGSCELNLGIYGQFLIVPLVGALMKDTSDADESFHHDTLAFELDPNGERNFICAIHEFEGSAHRHANYPHFFSAAASVSGLFDGFCRRFAAVPDEYKEISQYAIYTLWSQRMSTWAHPDKLLTFLHNVYPGRAYLWHQFIHAAALFSDPDEAFNLLCSAFSFQSPLGGSLPVWADYFVADCQSRSLPVEGFALDFLMHRTDADALEDEKCELLYSAISRLTHTWLDGGESEAGDLSSPRHNGTADFNESAVVLEGAEKSPDYLTLLILLASACEKLAARCGKTADAKKWQHKMQHLVYQLCNDFWNGKKFAPLAYDAHRECGNHFASSYLPVILGNRLPDEIIDAVAAQIPLDSDFLSAPQLRSSGETQKKDSDLLIDPLCVQTLLAIGLFDAGKKDSAKAIEKNICDRIKEHGIISGSSFCACGETADAHSSGSSNAAPWSSLTASCFMILASLILREE